MSEVLCIPIGLSTLVCTFDRFEVHACGVLRLLGWRKAGVTDVDGVACKIDGDFVDGRFYGEYRADLAGVSGVSPYAGFCMEWKVAFGAEASEVKRGWSVHLGDLELASGQSLFRQAHYNHLFHSDEVFGREHFYTSGATPPTETSAAFIELFKGAQGKKVLDFGCGTGVLVRELRQRGHDVTGIDLERDWNVNNVLPEARAWVKFYDGSLPSEWADGSFDIVSAFEVIEHIADYTAVVAELFRIAREKVIVSVLDIEAVALGAQHYLVPWHMLEADHVNFFTGASLHATLAPHCRSIEIVRVHPKMVNGTTYYVNLIAVCTLDQGALCLL